MMTLSSRRIGGSHLERIAAVKCAPLAEIERASDTCRVGACDEAAPEPRGRRSNAGVHSAEDGSSADAETTA